MASATALASHIAKPPSKIDFDTSRRKKATANVVTYALRELRGGELSAEPFRGTTGTYPTTDIHTCRQDERKNS